MIMVNRMLTVNLETELLGVLSMLKGWIVPWAEGQSCTKQCLTRCQGGSDHDDTDFEGVVGAEAGWDTVLGVIYNASKHLSYINGGVFHLRSLLLCLRRNSYLRPVFAFVNKYCCGWKMGQMICLK